MSSRGFSKQLKTKATFNSQPSCFQRKMTKNENGRTNVGNFVYTAADMRASRKKVKPTCL